jgi:hypothetical protein
MERKRTLGACRLLRHGAQVAAVLLVGAGACARSDSGSSDTGSSGNTRRATATDTAVTRTTVKDTAVIRHDTTVTTDTLKKTEHGKKAKSP